MDLSRLVDTNADEEDDKVTIDLAGHAPWLDRYHGSSLTVV